MEDDMEPSISDLKCCLVCASPTSASSHFGCAASCLACTAFFRRTVSLGIIFKCSSQRQCRIYYEQRILCKACRFDRCIAAGMKPELGSSAPTWSVSSQSSVSDVINDPKPSDLPPFDFNYLKKEQIHTSDIRSRDLLAHFLEEEKNTTARRKIMFSNSPLSALNGCCGAVPYSVEDLSPFTVKSHNVHMRFDHLLSFEYTKNLPGFESLSPADRVTIFRYVIMGFCALDIAFLTSQMKMTEKGLIVFTNATYSSVLDLSTGWDNEDEITSAEKEKLILPMNQNFFYRLIKPMSEIGLDQTEYAALKALTLWRACYFELTPSAKFLAKEHEYGIIKGLHEYYKGRPEGPERMGTVILFIGNVFELYQLIVESYKKIELFNLIKIDMFVRELLQF